ncbi:MAG: PAS domain-containing protein [Firmicutes bacterium]|nr:PAS domain-containing protein [Bacillota bacterium]
MSAFMLILLAIIGWAVALVAISMAWHARRRNHRLLHAIYALDAGWEEQAATAWSETLDQLPFSTAQRLVRHLQQDRTVQIQREQQEARLAALLEAISSPLCFLDTKGSILLYNLAFKRFVRPTDGALQGKDLAELLPSYPLDRAITEALRQNRVVEREELTFGVAPGRRFHARLAPVAQAGLLVLLEDRTEKLQWDQIRADFIGNVSHELHAPITSIRGFVETLLDGAMADPQTARRFLAIVDRERLSQLIDDFLDLSRLESGASAPSLEEVDLSLLLTEQVELFQPIFERNGLQVQLSCDEAPIVETDPALVTQVLRNLLDNAVKYTPKGGMIRIGWKQEGDRLGISVQDNGPGIPSEDIPRIFERFYRVDKSHSRLSGGTGLGLAIAKHAAEQLHGEVSVESTLGLGSTFTLWLPKEGVNVR